MNVEFTRSFDRNFFRLSPQTQKKTKAVISFFLDYYASRQYPKGLRAHKCGRFLSLTVMMSHRVFLLPIRGGVRFVFVGDHQDAEDYLKR